MCLQNPSHVPPSSCRRRVVVVVRYYKGRSRRLLKFHVLITTYDDLIRDYEEVSQAVSQAFSYHILA